MSRPIVDILNNNMLSLFRKNKNRTLTIAHRGASSLAPENTLSAARRAFEIGADMWELDIRMSSDGQLMVVHDDTLSRTTDIEGMDRFRDRQPWPLHQFTCAELKELDAGSWYAKTDPFEQIREGHLSKKASGRYGGEPMLTLKEALVFAGEKNFPVNVEIKDLADGSGNQRVVGKLADLIEEMGVANQVLVSSFNHGYLKALKSEIPRVSTAALTREPLSDPIGLLKHLGADAYHANRKAITPGLIKELKKYGYTVNIYTINDEATMYDLIAAGASGIITDFPQVLCGMVKLQARE